MFPWVLISMSFTLISSLMLADSPLMVGLLILTTALCVSISYASFLSSWFAFLVFLIYIGGMLVMFSYFVALTPNQSKISLSPYSLVLPMVAISIPMVLSKSPCLSFINHTLHYLFIPTNSLILIFLALLLFLTMVIIVKITNLSKGPLRAFQYV